MNKDLRTLQIEFVENDRLLEHDLEPYEFVDDSSYSLTDVVKMDLRKKTSIAYFLSQLFES